ncbi:PadR family transcriptional regulator [Janthinobacterium fluminis]|uniref:PadR family transcriptional regulator n=1 Tax=Janthinobacterium fluminis TaxID=2987524 RepID=A0ABT5JZ10_9BURK|nr:PadR family transcriptional regulator [Janthinobacterium fluminis]MDC8756762.1 PadR family transcriptional regulator [Janthinobacterium fluminis]
MSLPHALITALMERPCSGLELARRFDLSIGHFWHATHQQIYRELGRLEEQGWVASLPPETGRGRKKVYRALPAGREELTRWVGESRDPKPMRDELMLRLRAEVLVGPTAVMDEIQRHLEVHRARLALYREIEARDFPPGDASRERQIQHLVLDAGLMLEALWVEWSEKALKVLSSSAAKDADAE